MPAKAKRSSACSAFCDAYRDVNCDVDKTATCTTGDVETYDEKLACFEECKGGDVSQFDDANQKCAKWCAIDPMRCSSVCEGANAQTARCDVVCPGVEAKKRSAACVAFCQTPGACPPPGAEKCEQPDAAIATADGQRCQRVCSRDVSSLKAGTKCATWCDAHSAECEAICTGPTPSDTCATCQASPPAGETRNKACTAWCSRQPPNTCEAERPICRDPWQLSGVEFDACSSYCATSAQLTTNGLCAIWCALNDDACRQICTRATPADDCSTTCKNEPFDSLPNACQAWCAANAGECQATIEAECDLMAPKEPDCTQDCSRNANRIEDTAGCSIWCLSHKEGRLKSEYKLLIGIHICKFRM